MSKCKKSMFADQTRYQENVNQWNSNFDFQTNKQTNKTASRMLDPCFIVMVRYAVKRSTLKTVWKWSIAPAIGVFNVGLVTVQNVEQLDC